MSSEERSIGQLLHTRTNNEALKTVNGCLFVHNPDLQDWDWDIHSGTLVELLAKLNIANDMFASGTAKVMPKGVPLTPISIETVALIQPKTETFGGILECVCNDGEGTMQVSINGGETWHTLRPVEVWKPMFPILVETIMFKSMYNVPVRIWGWKES